MTATIGFVILVILMSVFNAGLGVFVLMRNPRDIANRTFFAVSLLIALWVPANFFGSIVRDETLAILIVKADFAIGLVLANVFLLFANTVGRRLIQRFNLIWLTLPISIILAVLVFTGHVFDLKVVANGVEVKGALLGELYDPIVLIYLLAGIAVLLRKRAKSEGVVRSQVSIVLYGLTVLILLVAGTNLILPSFVSDVAVQNTAQRLGYLGFVLFNALATYAIIRHKLFNIRLVVARSIAYLLLLGTFTALYGASLFGVSRLFFADQTISGQQMAVFIALALVLALTFQPLRRFFEKATDSVFYRDRYDSQVVLDNVGTILASELLLENILERSLKEICGTIRLASGQFVIYNKDKIYKEIYLGNAPQKPLTMTEASQLHTGMIVTDELENGHRKDMLSDHNIRVSLMLQTKGQIVGYLFLGDKLSGEIYSKQDITVLEILRKELAVAIVNAKAYEEIANFNLTLQERIREATGRLRTANANLRVLDKAKDDFISMASHQLGTPLTAITGYLSMAIDDDKDNMTVQQREFVSFAMEAAERMTAMSLDLLNVSRLNSGRFIIQREDTDLNKSVLQEIKQLQPSADRKNLKLIYTEPEPPLPLIALDLSKTRQVIMNFIDNAIYYTPSGTITIALALAGDKVRFTVTDTGMGVPPAEQDKLFAKFYRAENARSARPDGTGLGLYLAKQVIEDQGGAIIFASEIGKGSTFGFELPLHP